MSTPSSGSRRTTLGNLSSSSVNARHSTLGPPRAGEKSGKPPRMSAGGVGFASSAPSTTKKQYVHGRGSSSISNISGNSSAFRTADPRHIGEKQFMNSSIRQLIDFLARHNYEGPLSPKILSKPSQKDFSNIVLFLFSLLDPNYKCTGKFEDEMISMFRFLGYPFSIAKSNITAVGSPHAWPVLLACIMWLVELLSYDEAASKSSSLLNAEQDSIGMAGPGGAPSGGDEDPSSSERGFYRYLGRAYGLFLSGKDDQYANLEEQFVGSFENKNVLIRDQMEALQTRNQALSNEIEEVRSRSAYLPQLVEKKREFQQSHAQFVQLMEELQKHRDQLLEKQQQRGTELERLLSSVASAQKEVAVLRDRVAHQELSPDDVANLVSERERLEEAQQQASEQRQSLQRRVWELEMALRDKVKALEDAAGMYHSVAEQLKLVPQTARNARGEDLSVEVDIRARKREGLLRSDVRHHVLPVLQQIRSELNSSTFELRGELMTEKEAEDECAAQAAELRDRTEELQQKIRRAEATYRRERELLDQSAELHARELDAMESRLALLRDTAAEEGRATAAKRRAVEAAALRAARRTEHERKCRVVGEAVVSVVGQCAAHREAVQQQLADLKDLYADRLQYFATGPVPSAVAAEQRSADAYHESHSHQEESHYQSLSRQLLDVSSTPVGMEQLHILKTLLAAHPPPPPLSQPHPHMQAAHECSGGSKGSRTSRDAHSVGSWRGALRSDEKSVQYQDIYPNDSIFEEEGLHVGEDEGRTVAAAAYSSAQAVVAMLPPTAPASAVTTCEEDSDASAAGVTRSLHGTFEGCLDADC